MADETWGAKVSPELKKEINELIEKSSLSAKEFLEQLISGHKISLLQGTDAQRSEDIQQVTYHLDKIKSSFLGLVEKGIDLKDNFAQSLEQESMLHKGIVDQQQKQIKLAQDERDKARLDLTEIQERSKELLERNSELEAVQKSSRITIELLNDQKELLENRLKNVSEIETEAQELRTQHADNLHQLEKLQAEAVQNVRIIELTKERLASVEEERGKSIAALSKSHETELAQLKEHLVSIERDKEQTIITLGRSHDKELASAQKVADLQIHAASVEANNRVLEATTKLKDEYLTKIDTLQDKIQTLTTRLHELELVKGVKQSG